MAYPTDPIYKLYNDKITGQPASVNTQTGINAKSIPLDPENTDYQEYLKWAETNTPEAAD